MSASLLLDFFVRNQQVLFSIGGVLIALAMGMMAARLLANRGPEALLGIPRSVHYIKEGDEQYNSLVEIEDRAPGKIPCIVVSRNNRQRERLERLGLRPLPYNPYLLRGLIEPSRIAELAGIGDTVLLPASARQRVIGRLMPVPAIRGINRGVALVAGTLLVVFGALLGSAFGSRKPIPKTVKLDAKELALDLSKPNLIIFVHGWRGDSDGTWLSFPNLMRQDPRFADTHVVMLNYPNFIARRNLTMGETASWLAEQLEGNGVDHYSKIAIIAHSIGGLVSRKLVLQRRRKFQSLGLLVEIGTPHLGTERYAQLFANLGIPIPGNDLVAEVKVGSDWLRELRNDWNALDPRPSSHCFTSPNDGLIPQDSALFQCDKFHYLPGFDHTAMVKPRDAADDRYQGPTREIAVFLHPPQPVPVGPPKTIPSKSERLTKRSRPLQQDKQR